MYIYVRKGDLISVSFPFIIETENNGIGMSSIVSMNLYYLQVNFTRRTD